MQNESIPDARGPVFCGVDTHADSHWLCVLDWRGRKVLSRQFPADAAGYEALAGAIAAAGEPACIAMEGTSSYGAGLTRHLASLGMPVREALSPARMQRRRPGQGKCDEADAERAARAAMSGSRLGTPKSQDGWVDGVRCMLAARSGAVKCLGCLGSLIYGPPVSCAPPGTVHISVANPPRRKGSGRGSAAWEGRG